MSVLDVSVHMSNCNHDVLPLIFPMARCAIAAGMRTTITRSCAAHLHTTGLLRKGFATVVLTENKQGCLIDRPRGQGATRLVGWPGGDGGKGVERNSLCGQNLANGRDACREGLGFRTFRMIHQLVAGMDTLRRSLGQTCLQLYSS